MYEQEKLEEADYFLRGMKSASDPKSFRFELSAFIGAARSALQYAEKEATSRPGGQNWYQNHLSTKPVVTFFRDKRNLSIHHEPVVPRTDVTIAISMPLIMTGTLHVQAVDAEGKVVSEQSTVNEPVQDVPVRPPETTYHHTFPDWHGAEDVLTLSERYLAEVRVIVTDGVAKGFLTP